VNRKKTAKARDADPMTLFRALADPIRLRILLLLRAAHEERFDDGRGCCRAGHVCVCDLTSVIDAPQPTVSRHLAYLRRAGLVTQRRHGLWKYYGLVRPATKFHAKVFQCLDALAAESGAFAPDAKRLVRECGVGCCGK
jgi:ArsR family transcriptional regulator